MAQKFLVVASIFVFAITVGMLLGEIDRDIIAAKEAKAKPATKLVQNKKPVVVAVPAEEKEEEEKPELRKLADCVENHFEGRMVLDDEKKEDNIQVLVFEIKMLRFCKEIDVTKVCSHEQKLTGEFVAGKDDDFYKQSMVRARALCKVRSTARTLQGILGR